MLQGEWVEQRNKGAHTAIPTPSFCVFWHSHPYIFQSACLYPFFLYNSSLKSILFLQGSFRIPQKIITATAARQEQSRKGLNRKELDHHHASLKLGAEPLPKVLS